MITMRSSDLSNQYMAIGRINVCSIHHHHQLCCCTNPCSRDVVYRRGLRTEKSRFTDQQLRSEFAVRAFRSIMDRSSLKRAING
uniref:Uncharacterized protein n=1 Tax=Oryza brachyantha TaxID=4533 RepID=J3MYK8_ORYBR